MKFLSLSFFFQIWNTFVKFVNYKMPFCVCEKLEKVWMWMMHCMIVTLQDTDAQIKSLQPAPQKNSEQYLKDRDGCTKSFDNWTEFDQITFVEHLLLRMCHFQHGQINSFLKPMLQRDFISALPGMYMYLCTSKAIHSHM